MALKSTVYRAELQISNIDRGYYANHTLTLARHPSETEARLMVRVLAFVMHADDRLEFGRGISTDDEPDLWIRDDTGDIRLWIEVGLPDERRLRRAAGRARSLALLAYGDRAAEVWWRRNEASFARWPSLTVWSIPDGERDALAGLAARSMKLQALVQDGQVTFSDAQRYAMVEPVCLQAGQRDPR